MPITVRHATPDDAEFIAAGNAAMALETENTTLDLDVLLPGVRAVLGDRTKGVYWVAEVDGTPAGQLMITWEWSDWRNCMMWWIQSVFIVGEFRRQGVYSALYDHIRALAHEDEDCGGIRLYVETENTRAQQTYQALGMCQPGYLVMEEDLRQLKDEKTC